MLLPYRREFEAWYVSKENTLKTRSLFRNPINVLEIIETVWGRNSLETPDMFLGGNAG
jgi:hypothetical protein